MSGKKRDNNNNNKKNINMDGRGVYANKTKHDAVVCTYPPVRNLKKYNKNNRKKNDLLRYDKQITTTRNV